MREKKKSLIDSLNELVLNADGRPVKFKTVFDGLKGRGIPVFLILLNIPFCLPVSIPGISTVFGLLIAFMGLRMAMGKRLYWPKWMMDKEISYDSFKKIVTNTIKGIEWAKKVIRPRFEVICQSTILHHLNGVFIVVFGLLLALPLPIPLTNYLSALPLIFLGLGLLEDDGLFVILAYVMGIFSLIFWASVFFYSSEGLQWLHKLF